MGVAIFDRMQDGDHSGAEVPSHKSTSHHIQHADTRYNSYLSEMKMKMLMRKLFMCDIVLLKHLLYERSLFSHTLFRILFSSQH